MTNRARFCLMTEFKMFAEDPPWGIYGRPREDNILLWDAVICGPFDTPLDGGKFKLTIQFRLVSTGTWQVHDLQLSPRLVGF